MYAKRYDKGVCGKEGAGISIGQEVWPGGLRPGGYRPKRVLMLFKEGRGIVSLKQVHYSLSTSDQGEGHQSTGGILSPESPWSLHGMGV